MDEMKRKLEMLFDDMLEYVKMFKHKTYDGVFEEGYARHKEVLDEVAAMCGESDGEALAALIGEFAHIIPAYAYEKIQKVSKSKRERLSVDFNMNMAVYVIPMLHYSDDPNCVKIAKRTVEIWNKMQVTSLKLSYSSHEEISTGFKKTMCYITTAVCESRNQPDDCYELETLRDYRDTYLMTTEEGRGIVENYYDVAPEIVMSISMREDAGKIYDEIYNSYLIPCIHMIEDGRNEECKGLYMDMVTRLQRQYLYS